MHAPNKGGWKRARMVPGRGPCSLHAGTPAGPAPPPFLPAPHVFLKPSVHILSPPGLAPYFNHKSPWQTSKYIRARLLSPSNNTSVDRELFMSPVTEMAISIGSTEAGLPCLPRPSNNLSAHFQSFIRDGHGFL